MEEKKKRGRPSKKETAVIAPVSEVKSAEPKKQYVGKSEVAGMVKVSKADERRTHSIPSSELELWEKAGYKRV